jgi:alginate O-acetyltransferase complex protein AlgI
MLFNSLTFIFFFLPIALLGYYGLGRLGRRWAEAWLVFISGVFYCWWTFDLIFLLTGSILFKFTIGAFILKAGEKERVKSLLLLLGITGNLSLLFYYKYFFPLLNWFGSNGIIGISHTYSMILPLGISFFTFTQIGYLIDCRGGVVKTSNFLDYSLFVTFFPHLIAGPILHHREILPQLACEDTYTLSFKNLSLGSAIFAIGLVKKDLIADRLAPIANTVFDTVVHPTLVEAWNGGLFSSLQLYFDFSGYSDMAIGLALLFGVQFPANFDSPYRATSIIDFWQRWHMTLTRYLTLYLYNPIALWVSRYRLAHGKKVSRQAISTVEGFVSMIVFPTFYTMILAGIWHGAGPQFLIFGLLHGLYLTINHAYRSFGPRESETPAHPMVKFCVTIGSIGLTYVCVVIAQIFFRATSISVALDILKGMVGLHALFIPHQTDALHGASELSLMITLLALYGVIWTMPNSLQIFHNYAPTLSKLTSKSLIDFAWKPTMAWALVTASVAVVGLLEVTEVTEFIYFRF